ncbi:hypothetical protein BCR35DRAFT_355612 [Leucosporidium creatinivorum]|uniref:DNA-directed RNA polymerase I subunit RPA34.5-domain-containing protein n=1 Tax=Leucosporidium creatinivorum TaxID=106004 RepID=A0A1Y2DAY3_9BASI|nr:hypothetical protein BCR35DRAFT_355612 [Leucosporidium creatinivorum]
MAKKSSKAVKEPSPAPSSSASSSSASSSSGSERSSASPEPEQQQQAAAPVVNSARSSKYKAPKGLKLVSGIVGKSAIDFDDLQANPELQLWAVRVPDGVKPSALDGLVINLPTDKKKVAKGPLATFTPKKSSTEYEVHFADEEAPEDAVAGQKRKRQEGGHGGEEMRSLVPLLPQKSKGDKLFAAPQPLTHHLVITRALPPSITSLRPSSTLSSTLIASQPSPVPGAILSATELLQPEVVAAKKLKREQPEGLKMRILLPGMRAVGGQGQFDNPPEAVIPARLEREEEGEPEVKMDVDEEETEVKSPKKEKKAKKEKKSKKVKEAEESD